jgi:hypothetical protein
MSKMNANILFKTLICKLVLKYSSLLKFVLGQQKSNATFFNKFFNYIYLKTKYHLPSMYSPLVSMISDQRLDRS